MALPSNLIPVGNGCGPNGGLVPFYVDRQVLDTVRDEGPAWLFHDARFIEEAVCDPDAIFEGLRRPNHVEALCYSVRPSRDPDEDERDDYLAVPPVFGRVFLAFAQIGPMGYVVFGWEWREEDPDEPGHPEDWQADFGSRIWNKP